MDERIARLRAHRKNIERYQTLLKPTGFRFLLSLRRRLWAIAR